MKINHVPSVCAEVGHESGLCLEVSGSLGISPKKSDLLIKINDLDLLGNRNVETFSI